MWRPEITVLVLVAFLSDNIVSSPANVPNPKDLRYSSPTEGRSYANSTEQYNDIPSDFKVLLFPTAKSVNVVAYYINSIRALVDESQETFFASTNGFIGREEFSPNFVIRASDSIYPHLLHCHVVWTIQRLAEVTFPSGPFKELRGQIVLKGRTELHELGTLSLSPNAALSVSGLVGDATRNATIADTTATMSLGELDGEGSLTDLSQIPVDSSLSLTNVTIADLDGSYVPLNQAMRMNFVYLENGLNLKSPYVFLTLIRALAQIAEMDDQAPVTEFRYSDPHTEVRFEMHVAPDKPQGITNLELSEAMYGIFIAMTGKKRFYEMVGELFRLDPGKVEFAVVAIRKYTPDIDVS